MASRANRSVPHASLSRKWRRPADAALRPRPWPGLFRARDWLPTECLWWGPTGGHRVLGRALAKMGVGTQGFGWVGSCAALQYYYL